MQFSYIPQADFKGQSSKELGKSVCVDQDLHGWKQENRFTDSYVHTHTPENSG